MTDLVIDRQPSVSGSADAIKSRIAKRYRAEARFRAYGIAAIVFSAVFLVILIADIVFKAIPAFTVSYAVLQVTPTAETLEANPNDPAALQRGNFLAPVRQGLLALFPSAGENRRERLTLFGLLSNG